jgi:hypothetical protein
MTEQEKFYKFIREVIEAMLIGFGLSVFAMAAFLVWVVLS